MVSGSLFLAGCSEPETIRVYQVPKGKVIEHTERHFPGDGHDHGEAASAPAEERSARSARPKPTYQVPAGWVEIPQNQVSVANFNIDGENGQKANVSIAALPPLANRETEVVNMWRQQLGLSEMSATETASLLSEVDVAGTKGKLFDLVGGGSEKTRITTVMQHTPEASWFYKISGDDALVIKEKGNFLAFIKSVKFPEAATTEASTSSGDFKWKVPGDWKEVAPGAMQDAKFQLPPQNGATGEVTISVFPSDTGGNLANVNRWRGQIKLAPVDEAGLAKLVQPLGENHPGAVLVDMENQGDRMIGAIVPRGGKWFFYKMRGASAVVGAQKAAFIAFAQSEP